MPRPAPSLVPLALAVGLVASAGARADEGDPSPNEHYTLRGELGAELDTNAHRSEIVHAPGVVNPPVVSSALARAVLTGALSDVVGDGHQVAASATVAGKLFKEADARDEDIAVLETTLAWRAPLGERSALTLAGGVYDAFQRDAAAPVYSADRRDFLSATPTLRLSRVVGPHTELGLAGGYRVFEFKSDRSFDFQAPTAGLDLRWARETDDGAADWEALARAAYERRAFDGAPYVEPASCASACPPLYGTGARLDDFVTGALDVSRTGRVLLGAGYALHVNLSNSYGETVTRHFFTARVAAALPLDVYVAVRAELLVARYREQVFVAQTMDAARPYASIEDENRNSVRADLSRNLTDRLQLIARYTYYSNEVGAGDVTYRRQTALLSLAFTLEK